MFRVGLQQVKDCFHALFLDESQVVSGSLLQILNKLHIPAKQRTWSERGEKRSTYGPRLQVLQSDKAYLANLQEMSRSLWDADRESIFYLKKIWEMASSGLKRVYCGFHPNVGRRGAPSGEEGNDFIS